MEVYFDDFKVEHVKSPIISTQDYYPFGLAFNSQNRESSLPQNFLYQEKEWQKDISLNLYDFEWRQYDPLIGRTTTLDPHGDDYEWLSSYSWIANNPLSLIDPDGRNYTYTDADIAASYSGAVAQQFAREEQMRSEARSNQSSMYSFNSKNRAREKNLIKQLKIWRLVFGVVQVVEDLMD